MRTRRSIGVTALLTLVAFLAVTNQVSATHPPNLGQYHTYGEMLADLQSLESAYPSRAQLVSIGHGWELVGEFEQRQIWALKISDNVSEDEGEPEIVFVGAHHAREWISVEVPLALAHHLLDNYASDASIKEVVDHKAVWVIPMLNPDGHVYSATTDRCWRKNRRNNGDGTFGVDLNRNYGYQWGLTSGSSGATYAQTYRGPSSFSEPETQALRDFLRARSNLRAVVTYHNYTQSVLRPWSYTLNFTPGEPPPLGELMLRDLSDELRDQILAVHGETYKDCLFQADRLPSGACPSPPHYESSGEMTDWVYHEFNIPAFTIELRPRNGSQWPSFHACGGFELPESEIAPTIEENIPAAMALIHYTQPGDIMIRDYIGDTGAVPSSTSTPSGWDPVFWLSPDIRSDPPVPVQGETATVTARVHNLSSAPTSNVTVQIFFSDPSISLEFPSPDAMLLGEGTINLPASGFAEFSAPWPVPTDPNAVGDHHWCVGVVVKHPDDLPISTQAIYSNNVAYHNFAPVGTATASQALRFLAQNDSTIDMDLDVFVTTEGLPKGWQVELDPDRPDVLSPGERYLGFAEVTIPAGAEAGEGLVAVHGVLQPRRPGTIHPIGSGVTYRVTYEPSERLRPKHVALLRSLEDLLKNQQGLIGKLGKINRELLATRELPDERALSLVEAYQRLVAQQAELVQRFEGLVHGTLP
jgi:hypothetical protein